MLPICFVNWQISMLPWKISDQGTALIDATVSPFEFAMTVHSIPASPGGIYEKHKLDATYWNEMNLK